MLPLAFSSIRAKDVLLNFMLQATALDQPILAQSDQKMAGKASLIERRSYMDSCATCMLCSENKFKRGLGEIFGASKDRQSKYHLIA